MTLSAETGARTSLYCATEPSLSDPQYSGKTSSSRAGLDDDQLQGNILTTVKWDPPVPTPRTRRWPANSGTSALNLSSWTDHNLYTVIFTVRYKYISSLESISTQ